ncbi:MAG: adenylate/guanylate cyclase domain-containing protein, partial [Alphaproteobacteria bacterium]
RTESTVIFRSAALEREMAEMAAERPRPPKPAPAPEPKAKKPAKPAVKSAAKGGVTTKEIEEFSLLRVAPAILVAFLFSCMVGAAFAVGVSYGLQTVVGMGLVLARKAQLAVLLGVFAITTAYTLFFLLRRIMRKAVTRRTVSIKTATSEDADQAPAAPEGNSLHPSAPADPQDVQRLAGAERMAAAFTDQILERLAGGFGQLDAGQRFALDVYAGGAIECLVQSLGLSRDDFQNLLKDPLRRLKAPPELIERFGGLIEGYLSQPRVRRLYDAGRHAMTRLLAGQTNAIDPQAALQLWQDQSQDTDASDSTDGLVADSWGEDEAQPRYVAVLYTDAVMPADDQSRKAARRIFVAHAKIARTALAALGGTEFEHDGDGILASFEVPSQAVEAALHIQAGIAQAENSRKSATGLAARIGIHVGESTREDGELIGNPVEIASFLSNRGAAGQILTSQKIRDLCDGQDHQFDHRGEEQIDGSAEAVSYYELVGP